MARDLPSHWDVVVVGTGMAGATLGLALARAGRRVLFLEQGSTGIGDAGLRGRYPELEPPRRGGVLGEADRDLLHAAGREAGMVLDRSAGRERRFVPYVGAGAGGSSALYGMALERFLPADFTPRLHLRDAPEAAVVDAWPVSFDEMLPWYRAAEALYGVRGTTDPLAARFGAHDPARSLPAPPPLTPAMAELAVHLQRGGCHPYRLPMACEFVAGCQGCQGVLCPLPCKNDAARVALAPAVRDHGAALQSGARVVALDADRRRVRSVVAEVQGRQRAFTADVVVLAAGALQTPALLLRSRGEHWPRGLANGSGLVGRHLMRHLIDIHLVRVDPALRPGLDNRRKEIAFSDFCVADGERLGSVQSFGRLPPVPMITGALADDLRAAGVPAAGLFTALASPLLRPVLRGLVDDTLGLAAITEDLPYADNRVEPGPQGSVVLHYRLRAEGHRRVGLMRRRLSEVLRGRLRQVLEQHANNQRIAHVCGTCRFGDDPRTSVLDRHNRAHELDNLHVVDASFFPSSGGTNPSLTIAANALRVGAHLA
jgi:choline dehydrogenase-like flavoprotein